MARLLENEVLIERGGTPMVKLFVGRDYHKFSAAHMTVFPDGTKERLHGHHFQVHATVEVESTRFKDFFEFGELKKTLGALCDAWDEALLLPKNNPFLEILSQKNQELEFKLCGKRYVVPEEDAIFLDAENITVEEMARLICEELAAKIRSFSQGKQVQSVSVEVSESPGQGAVYSKNLR